MIKCLLALLLFAISFSTFSSISITTYNIRNFNYNSNGKQTNLKELAKIIKSTKSHIIGVQEIKNELNLRKFVKDKLTGYSLSLSKCGGGGGQKLGFIYKKARFKIIETREDRSLTNILAKTPQGCGSLRPAFILKMYDKTEKVNITGIVVHLKAGGGNRNYYKRWLQYEKLSEIINKMKKNGEEHLFVLGDFNTTGYLDQDTDYRNFLKMMNMSGLVESTKTIDCSNYWKAGRRLHQPSKLDHVLVTPSFMNLQRRGSSVYGHCKQKRCIESLPKDLGLSYNEVSDHCPVKVTFQ